MSSYLKSCLLRPCSYRAAHTRTIRYRGHPTEHRCIDCGGVAAHWSYRGGSPWEQSGTVQGNPRTWSAHAGDYDPRCVPCHWKHDGHAERLVAWRTAHPGVRVGGPRTKAKETRHG